MIHYKVGHTVLASWIGLEETELEQKPKSKIKLILKMMVSAAVFVIPIFIGLFIIRKFRERQWGICKSNSLLWGKAFLITGCTSGIGLDVAKNLAARHANVIFACRDRDRVNAAMKEIRKFTQSGTLVTIDLDLSSLESVRKCAEEINKLIPRLHCLILNAGVYYPITSNEKTVEGHEINFGVNYLGHFLLANLLMDLMKKSAPSRIVIVSSGLHEKGSIDVDDLNMEKRKKELPKLDMKAAYCASKLANVYHSRELAQRLKGTGVSVFAVCPGFTYTNLFRHSIGQTFKWWHYIAFSPIAFFFMRTSWQGAQTVLHCATAGNLESMSGEFFRNCKLSRSKFKFDPETQKMLWEKSEELTRVN